MAETANNPEARARFEAELEKGKAAQQALKDAAEAVFGMVDDPLSEVLKGVFQEWDAKAKANDRAAEEKLEEMEKDGEKA